MGTTEERITRFVESLSDQGRRELAEFLDHPDVAALIEEELIREEAAGEKHGPDRERFMDEFVIFD